MNSGVFDGGGASDGFSKGGPMLGRSNFAGFLGVLLFVSGASAQPGGFPGGPFPGGPPGGPFQPPQPGQLLNDRMQDQLKLTAEQKKQLAEVQKEVDAKLEKILTSEQKKALKDPATLFGGFGGFGPPGGGGGFGGGPPGGGGGFGGGPPGGGGGFGGGPPGGGGGFGGGPPGGGGGFGGGPPGGGFGPGGFGGGFGAGNLDDVKKQLSATDEEWKIVGAKLQKVIAARQVVTSDNRNAFPAGPGPGFGGPSGNMVSQAQAELKAVIDDPKHTKTEVEEKVAAVRKARQKAKSELETAQKDLLKMLTSAQEAVLVSLGYLD
jgi:Spy/CpxP family protein refolding chaperone